MDCLVCRCSFLLYCLDYIADSALAHFYTKELGEQFLYSAYRYAHCRTEICDKSLYVWTIADWCIYALGERCAQFPPTARTSGCKRKELCHNGPWKDKVYDLTPFSDTPIQIFCILTAVGTCANHGRLRSVHFLALVQCGSLMSRLTANFLIRLRTQGLCHLDTLT